MHSTFSFWHLWVSGLWGNATNAFGTGSIWLSPHIDCFIKKQLSLACHCHTR